MEVHLLGSSTTRLEVAGGGGVLAPHCQLGLLSVTLLDLAI